MPISSRRVVVNLLIVVIAILVTLAAAEVAVRLFRPTTVFAVTVNTWDRVCGTRHIPGARGYVQTDEYKIDLIINSKGLRDREFPYEKPDGTMRILCLGDSFTCGYGVEGDETYPKVMERVLNAEDGQNHKWEVLNAGVGSIGTSHQLAYFTTEGYKYHPDFVLLCFFGGNDYWDNIISGLYTLEDGRLVKRDAPLTSQRVIQRLTRSIPGYNVIFRRSHLLSFVKRRVTRLHYKGLAERFVRPDSLAAVEREEYELTAALVLELIEACNEAGCRLVMTCVPDATRGWTYYEETKELAALVNSRGVPFVYLDKTLAEAAASGVAVRFKHDGHWTREGHQLAGRKLAEFFAGLD